jgi:3-dehydroquinate synthase
LAEVIKYGIIEDPALFCLLEKEVEKVIGLDRELLIEIITTSCAIKARVVEKDEREADYRAVLNFGHTIGHALEAASGYRRFLHGEAVAVGMVQAAAISVREGFCDRKALERVRNLVRKAGLPDELPEGFAQRGLIQAMEIDKKSAGGQIKFVMCAGIGRTQFHWLAPEEIMAALESARSPSPA